MKNLNSIVFLMCLAIILTNSQMRLQTFGILMRYEVDDQVNDTLKIQQIMKFYESLTCSYKITQITFQFPTGRIAKKQINFQKIYSSIQTTIDFQIYPVQSQGNTISPNKKFKVPNSDLQQIYFLTNTQLFMNFECAELQQMLGAYQSKIIGQLGPLIGYHQASHTYATKEPPGDKIDRNHTLILQYIQNPNSLYYSMIKLDHAFVSKHFLDLYYTNLTDVVELRNMVESQKDCESIALNVLVSLYYPQLRPWKIKRNQLLSGPAFEYGKASQSEIKNACLKEILQLYGYFPLTSYSTNTSNFGLQMWQNQGYAQNVNSKKEYIEKFIGQIKQQFVPAIPFKELVHKQKTFSIYQMVKDFIKKMGIWISILSGLTMLGYYAYQHKKQQQLSKSISSSFFEQQQEKQQLK